MAIGKEHYFLSADGYLMPARGQAPPDLVLQSKQVLNSSSQRHDGTVVKLDRVHCASGSSDPCGVRRSGF